MTKTITGKLPRPSAAFESFFSKALGSITLLKSLSADPRKALLAQGLAATDSPLTASELKQLADTLLSIREAAALEGTKLTPRQVFDQIFAINDHRPPIRRAVAIRSEMSGTPHTGYNEGWSNSSSRTAHTTEGRHKIFPYEANSGSLMNPAERAAIMKKLGALAAYKA